MYTVPQKEIKPYIRVCTQSVTLFVRQSFSKCNLIQDFPPFFFIVQFFGVEFILQLKYTYMIQRCIYTIYGMDLHSKSFGISFKLEKPNAVFLSSFSFEKYKSSVLYMHFSRTLISFQVFKRIMYYYCTSFICNYV